MKTQKIYKIAIADDEKLFLNGLSMLLNQHPSFHTTILANDGQDLINRIGSDPSEFPDLILCDMEMPKLNGIETTKKLIEKYPEVKIIILSSHYEPMLILKMLELGASSYMPKNEEPEIVFNTLLNVSEHGFYYNNFVMQLIRDKLAFKQNVTTADIKLTLREKEILELICEQKTNQEIGNQLFISKRTVEGHRNKLLFKTNSKNTAGLIIFAIQHGYFDVELQFSQWNKLNNSK